MLKLEITDIANLMKSGNRFEKIGIVLQSSDELEDFLLTMAESFDFQTGTISLIESIVKEDPVDLNHDFMKHINKIKEKRDGFEALIFCLRHFGFEKVDESMQQIFEFKVDPYRNFVNKLYSFRTSVKGKPAKLKKLKPKQVIHHGELAAQRLYAPVQVDLRDYPQALGVYTPDVGKNKRLLKVLGSNLTELHIPRAPVELEMWTNVPRGLFALQVRRLRKEHGDIEIKKEGVARIINIYSGN